MPTILTTQRRSFALRPAAWVLVLAWGLPGPLALAVDEIAEPAGEAPPAADERADDQGGDPPPASVGASKHGKGGKIREGAKGAKGAKGGGILNAGKDLLKAGENLLKSKKQPRGGKDDKDGKDDNDGREDKDDKDGDDKAAVWDSYSDKAAPSVAQEVSKGVRVEDIVEPPTDYRYAAFGKADPFLPPMITDEAPAGADPLEIPIISPLQRYNLSELSVVGIWQLRTGERKAMIMAPAGKGGGAGQGIIVKTGDPVGNRGGKILAVADDYLTVREFSLAPDGTRQYEDQPLYMGRRNPDDQAGKIRFTPGQKKTQVLMEGGAAAASLGLGAAADDAGTGGRTGAAAASAVGLDPALKLTTPAGGALAPAAASAAGPGAAATSPPSVPAPDGFGGGGSGGIGGAGASQAAPTAFHEAAPAAPGDAGQQLAIPMQQPMQPVSPGAGGFNALLGAPPAEVKHTY